MPPSAQRSAPAVRFTQVRPPAPACNADEPYKQERRIPLYIPPIAEEDAHSVIVISDESDEAAYYAELEMERMHKRKTARVSEWAGDILQLPPYVVCQLDVPGLSANRVDIVDWIQSYGRTAGVDEDTISDAVLLMNTCIDCAWAMPTRDWLPIAASCLVLSADTTDHEALRVTFAEWFDIPGRCNGTMFMHELLWRLHYASRDVYGSQ
ncbi:hypothetical protein HK105_202016 [Polyrhizophydium stewartii]|uniref:Uncharacterized protein n=1 Tax=Polyrhizophydium stewartii TaxID=2732419 RepID=A0ABR4NGM4_9FUNG